MIFYLNLYQLSTRITFLHLLLKLVLKTFIHHILIMRLADFFK